MNEEIKNQVERSLRYGKFEELRSEITEILRSCRPLISEAQLDDFIGSPVYSDFLREMQAWIVDLEEIIVSGQTEHSIEYLRGCVQGIRTSMGFTEYVRKQIQDAQEESEDFE